MHKKLTSRQMRILLAYGQTGSSRRAAERLFLSERTVRNTLSSVYDRLGVDNGVSAVWTVFVEGDAHYDRGGGVSSEDVPGKGPQGDAGRRQ